MRSVFLPEDFATQEVAGDWELGKTALILIIWLVLGLLVQLKHLNGAGNENKNTSICFTNYYIIYH